MGKFKTMVGEKFGRLVVDSCAGRTKTRQLRWLCKCECGGETTTVTYKLKSGHTRSCGCLQKERAAKAQTRHGLCGSPTYESWRAMIARCTNQKDKSFQWYGLKGIKVCEPWLKFDNFLSDMGERPSGHTIERIDVNAGYEKSNCKWTRANRQQANTSANVFVEHDGRRMCIADWAREFGMPYGLLQARLRRGASMDEAVKHD